MAEKVKTVTTTVTDPNTKAKANYDSADDGDPYDSSDTVNIHVYPKKDRVPWQRITLSVTGILIIVGMWRWAVFHLYVLPDHSIVAFTSLTNNSMYVIAALVIFFVTGKLVYDWKNTTATSLIDTANHVSQDFKNQTSTNNTNTNVNVDLKGSIVDQNDPNSPENKPFTQHTKP